MSIINEGLLYTNEHEWLRVEADVAVVGITDYAQEELGDIVYVELPEINAEVDQMDEVGIIESVKTVSNLYSPLSGVVVEVNEEVVQTPDLVNSSPYDEAWLFKIKMADDNELSDLMNHKQYEVLVEGSTD